MEPAEKDRMIELQQTRIEHLNKRIARLENALLMWVKANNETGEDKPVMLSDAVEETRLLIGDEM